MRSFHTAGTSVAPAVYGVLLALSMGLQAQDAARVRDAEAKAADALERLARDLAGVIPADSGAQAFCFFDVGADNGRSVKDGDHGARDAMMFWTTTMVRDEVSDAHITWFVDDEGEAAEAGPRRMVLKRIVRCRKGEAWAESPLVSNLCHDVTSFNIEVLYDPDGPAKPALQSFVQLGGEAAGPYATRFDWWGQFPHPAKSDQVPPASPKAAPYCSGRIGDTGYPIGVAIDPPGAWQWPPLPVGIRVTMRIVVDGESLHERLMSRVIWIIGH